jgi:hypothetical protein
MNGATARERLARIGLGITLAIGVAAIPVGPVLAAAAVDQSNVASGGVDFIHDVWFEGQTFTAGVTGSLEGVTLAIGRLSNPGPLTVQVQAVAAGLPSGVVVASAVVATAAVDADGGLHDVAVDLPATLSTAGTEYALVLSATGAPRESAWLWGSDNLNGYAGGVAAESNHSGTAWAVKPVRDRTFATLVDPTPCAAGTWSAVGYGQCAPADPGHYAAGPGATSQTTCASGSFQPDGGAPGCLEAPIGSYVDTDGAVAPTPCPDGRTTLAAGASSAEACVALAPVLPPTIVCTASPRALWPPNNRMVAINVAVTTTDSTTVRLVSVTADEDITGDIAGWTVGIADLNGLLRAERDGPGDGRAYSLLYEAANEAGDTARCTATVVVPHDQRNL